MGEMCLCLLGAKGRVKLAGKKGIEGKNRRGNYRKWGEESFS